MGLMDDGEREGAVLELLVQRELVRGLPIRDLQTRQQYSEHGRNIQPLSCEVGKNKTVKGAERGVQGELVRGLPIGDLQRLVFKAHRLLYHSTLGLRVIKRRRSANTPAMFSR